MPKYRILVIDDESLMREYVEEAMRRAGHAVEIAATGAEGLRLFERGQHDLLITDLKMTPMDGLEVLAKARALAPETPVIVMTAYGTIETAVTALKNGAADYILKPFTPDAINIAVNRALERRRLSEENRYLRAELDALHDCGAMVGASAPMQAVYEQIRKVADTRATVLVRGESGTGKELVARAVHQSSNRRDRSFIKVNCAALSAGILESELFGHERGAFTGAHERKVGRFELADAGSLLLDEISEIGMELQPKLLRALQEREIERVGGVQTIPVDVRIIATSNRDLEKAVREGHFREDLFFRLNVVAIVLPPLRERTEDIPSLMDHFLERFCRENGRGIKGFGTGVRAAFQAYPWPGNVRELQNAIERAVIMASGDTLELRHFQLSSAGLLSSRENKAGLRAGVTVAEIEKELILTTLEHCAGNRTRASEMLGIAVRTLRNKLKEYGAGDAGSDEEE